MGLELLLVQHLDREVRACETPQALGELHGAQHVGGLVDEVAGEEDAVSHGLADGERLGSRFRVGAVDEELLQPVARWLALPIIRVVGAVAAARPVLVESVATQQGAERQVRGEGLGARLARVGDLGNQARAVRLAGGDLRIHVASEAQPVVLAHGAPGAGKHNALGLNPGGRQDLDRRPRLAGETRRARGPDERALATLVDRAPRSAERHLLACQHDRGRGQRVRQGHELDCEGRRHLGSFQTP